MSQGRIQGGGGGRWRDPDPHAIPDVKYETPNETPTKVFLGTPFAEFDALFMTRDSKKPYPACSADHLHRVHVWEYPHPSPVSSSVYILTRLTYFFQVKMILRAYKEKMSLGIPSNFSSLEELDVDALGRFIFELDDADLENLSNYSGIEAVRQMGELNLKEKPRGIIEGKLKVALKLIVSVSEKKAVGAIGDGLHGTC